jgi:hypothetical protein
LASTEEKIRKLVEGRSEYGEILRVALQLEEKLLAEGWEWHQVRGHPGMLTKLVGEGVIVVVSRGRRTRYRLADREAVRRALVPG